MGKEEMPVIKEQSIKFLLMDLNLPDIDGREIIKEARQN